MHLNDALAQGKDNGLLPTAESGGKVNAAIYAKRHIMAEGIIALSGVIVSLATTAKKALTPPPFSKQR